MINKIRESLELTLLVFIMFLFIIGVGIYGVLKIKESNNSSKELYADRMLPMDQLGDIRFYASNIIAAAHQINSKQITYDKALQEITRAQDSINTNWKNYQLTYLTDKEKQLVLTARVKIDLSDRTIEKLKLALKKEDASLLESIVKNELYPDLNSVILDISDLLRLQVEIGKKINQDSADDYHDYIQKFIWILIALFGVSIPFLYYLIKKSDARTRNLNLNNAKLFLTEDNYRNLIEYAGEAILILDEETNIIDLNHTTCAFLGYSREELLAMKISDLVLPEEVEKQEADINAVRENKFAVLSRKIRRKDGSLIETEISNRLMEGKVFFAIIRDVTERKKADQIIKKSEKKYRYLFDNNPAYIIIWDLETMAILEVNRAVLDKYGYSREEWAKMTVLDYRPKEDYSRIKEFAQNMLIKEGENCIVKNNWLHYKKNGEEMIMEITSHKINYNDRRAILSLANDVTNEVKAEAKLKEREAQLDLFIRHSPASLAMFDNEMRYIVTSHRWIEDYNLSGQDIIGKSHYEVFPEIGQEWKDIHQRCLQGAIEKSEEDSFLREDGSLEWIKWEIHPWYKYSSEIGGIIMFTEVITEHKRATEMFKYQFENSPDFILYVNKLYKIELINKDSPIGTVNELIGVNCIEVLPEKNRGFVKGNLDKCFQTGCNQEFETELNLGRWVRSRFVPIKNNGEVTHVMIFTSDITKRKQAEIQLLKSEERYRALIENVSDAILLLDEEAKIVYQSPSAERISGYSFEEAKGKRITDFLYPDALQSGQLFLKEIFEFANVSMQNQFKVVHKKGHKIWLEGTVINLLGNDSIHGIIINYRDITKRKELESQQALMGLIVDSSDDGIISKTLDGDITSWNKGAEKILGYSSDETIGKHISMLLPLDLLGEEEKILTEIRKGNAVDHYETIRKKKNGELVHVSLTISPIYDELGNVIGASKIMRDITENKAFENELIRYNIELKKANSELDRFVYSASHDLRAPLKSMLGLINITKESIEPNDTTLQDRLAMLNGSVEKLDGFIEDILNYSRNTRMELVREIIDFEKLIQEIKLGHKYREDVEKVKFKYEIISDGKFVSDYRRLGVIIANLCSNAIKYKDVAKEDQYVNLTISSDKNRALFIIEDNGIGIAENDKERIFEMFYRATTYSSGSGLGLYIVKETLEKLGGKIVVESQLSKGTKFIVEIPNQIDNLI